MTKTIIYPPYSAPKWLSPIRMTYFSLVLGSLLALFCMGGFFEFNSNLNMLSSGNTSYLLELSFPGEWVFFVWVSLLCTSLWIARSALCTSKIQEGALHCFSKCFYWCMGISSVLLSLFIIVQGSYHLTLLAFVCGGLWGGLWGFLWGALFSFLIAFLQNTRKINAYDTSEQVFFLCGTWLGFFGLLGLAVSAEQFWPFLFSLLVFGVGISALLLAFFRDIARMRWLALVRQNTVSMWQIKERREEVGDLIPLQSPDIISPDKLNGVLYTTDTLGEGPYRERELSLPVALVPLYTSKKVLAHSRLWRIILVLTLQVFLIGYFSFS